MVVSEMLLPSTMLSILIGSLSLETLWQYLHGSSSSQWNATWIQGNCTLTQWSFAKQCGSYRLKLLVPKVNLLNSFVSPSTCLENFDKTCGGFIVLYICMKVPKGEACWSRLSLISIWKYYGILNNDMKQRRRRVDPWSNRSKKPRRKATRKAIGKTLEAIGSQEQEKLKKNYRNPSWSQRVRGKSYW